MMVFGILAAAVIVLALVSPAFAQQPDPLYPGNGGRGNGGNGGNGGMNPGTGTPLDQNLNLEGLLSEHMNALMADALGISVEELVSRQEAGETLMQIGLSYGLMFRLQKDFFR